MHILTFLERIATGRLDSSTATRLEQIQLITLTLENNGLLGYPIVNKVIENAYAHYFYVYGLIGLLAYLWFVAVFAVDASMRLKRAAHFYHGNHLALAIAMLCLVLSIVVFALGASPTDANKASYWFFCLYGLYCGADDNSFLAVRFNPVPIR